MASCLSSSPSVEHLTLFQYRTGIALRGPQDDFSHNGVSYWASHSTEKSLEDIIMYQHWRFKCIRQAALWYAMPWQEMAHVRSNDYDMLCRSGMAVLELVYIR